MFELSRKERELLERETLILDAAQTMLHEHGYGYLTMDKVALAAEYSKGTIYNHFTSKEDLICSLCCRCINNLIDLFERAANYDGTTRDQFSAIGIAYSLYYQLHPLDAQNIQIVKTNAVREKLSDSKETELESLEQRIIEIGMEVIHKALKNGDIKSNNEDVAEAIMFGCWSMHYGALLLDQSDIPLNDLGFSPRTKLTWINSQKFMDGFNWHPLSTEIDIDKQFKEIAETLFSNELNAGGTAGE